MQKSPSSTRTGTQVLRRKKFVGLTMLSLLFLDSVNQGLAHGAAGSGWAPPAVPQTSALHTGNVGSPSANGWATHAGASAFTGQGSAFGDIGKSQSGIPLIHQMPGHAAAVTNFNAAAAIRHAHANPTGLTFVNPNTGGFTNELGQTGHNLALDLTSTTADIVLGSRLFGGAPSVTIDVGGQPTTYRAGSVVTAGEYVAIQQVLGGHTQGVTLSNSGAATGGNFVLNAVDNRQLQSLVIPASVSAVDYFSKSPVLTINADLTNYGSIYGVSTNPNITNGTIIAHDITNAVGGTISTVIPDSMVSAISGTINSSLDLSLYATNNFTNAGSIYGSGVVNIFAGNNIVNALPTGVSGPTPVIHAVNNVNFMTGSGNFTNAGVVASANNNINILAAEATTNLNINNVGGSLQALQGDINVRDASYDGSASVTMTGGDFLSNNLNIYSGTGDIYGDVGQVTGNLNTVGGAAHFYAATDNLSLGKNCLVGDPTFANTTGGITINGQVTAAENIVILAATNIIASGPGAEIDTANSGGSITMVAGATITNTGIDTSGTPTGTGAIGAGKQAQADFGTVTTGGSIILTGGAASPVINTSTSSNNLSAGNVTLVAMAGTTAGSGVVSLPVNSINASSAGATAPGGNVTIIANGTGANTITAGAINTTSAQNVSGNVSITTTTATVNAPNASPLGGGTNNSIVFNNDGTTASGNFIVPGNAAGAFVPSSPTAGGVTINNAINAGSSGSVNINAGSISTSNAGSITGTQVALTTVSSLGSGGAITAKGAINADNLTVQTAGGAVSGGNIQLGAIGGSAGGDATSVTVTTGGAGGSGGTITFTGTVNADTLDVTSGGAGGFGGDININGALNANSMTIHAGGAGLQAGSVTATKGITADTLDLSTGGSGSGAGGNISLASVGGKSAADASSVTLDAGTSGGTIDASGAVSTQTLNLTSNGGNVGSNNGGITTDASTINAATANKGSLSLNTTAATATITTDSPTLSVKGTGNVTISDSYNGGSTPIVVNASSAGAGSTFQLTATGNDGANGTGLNVNSTLSAGNVLLTSAAGPTANGGDINVNGTISATNTTISTGNGPTNGGNITVGAAGVIKGLAGDATSVTLTAAGSGSIQDNGPGTSANILTNTLTMTSGTGTIGTGIPGTPLSGTAIATNASTVSASTGDTNPLEGIYINDFQTGAVFVNGLSSGSNVAFNGASSNLTLNGPISGFGIALANAGNIAIAGDITATGAQGILIETTNGFGNITQTNSKAIISDTTAGASIFLTSLIGVVPVGGGKGLGTGNIGAVGAPINVNAPQLLVQTASKSAVTGNVYLASLNTSGTSLSNSGSFGASQGGIIDVTSIGPVTIGTTVNNKLSAINADTVRISTSFGGGITLNQNINGQLGVGANANSITLAASGGGNIVDNSQNTQVTGANQGTLNTLSLTLSTGSGNIGTPGVGFGTGIVTNATTLQATSTGSYIFVNDQTNGTVNVLASSAGTGGNPVGFLSGSVFRVTSFGGVNTTGAISADNIGLIAGQGGTGNLNIGANLTALNNVFLNSTATSTGSDITQSAGLISAQNLIMLSDHGTIGQSAANIQTNAVQMSANIAQNTAPGNENVFINNINTNPVTLNASQAAGNFTLTTAGALTVNGMAVDGKVSITTANNGGVNLAGNIAGFKNVSGNAKSVTISADGSGDVENLGIFTISTDKLVISSGSGSIGDAPIITNATTLQFNTTGTVIVVDTAKTDVTLLASSASGAGSDFDLTMTGLTNAKLIISGALTAGNNADIQSNSGGGNIQISNTITAGTSANLVADGSVGITQTAGVVDTPLLTATTTNGGSIGASSVAPITTTATTITATSAGNAFLKATNANPVTITGVAAAGKTFQLTDTGSNGLIIVGAAGISGGKFINLLGGTGSNVGIELDGNVTAAGINSVITLAANGTGAITDVAQGAPTLSASSLVLSSGSGDIGASTAYIQTDAATVSTNTKGQSFINDSAALVNLAASTGSNITLNALAVNTTGNTTVTGNLNINTSTITNNNTLTGSTINVVGDNMLVLGTGQFTAAVVTNITSTLGDLNFGDGVVPGIMTFSGPANFTVPAFNAINVNDKYVVNGLNSVTLNTCTLNLNGTGTLFGNPIIFNCPLGAGTIANSTGDVNLTSNLIFNGKDLAIIASGNVIASSPITIDLSNTNPLVNKGNGGSLNILAGVDFTPGTNLGAGGQEGPDGVFYTIAAGGGAASISGGSIQMAGSLVRTASGVGSANSGTVTLAAYGGVTNPGSIAIGSITTAFAAGGKAGAVTVVGQGNVTVGSITAASGLNGADVVVSSATPVVVSTIKDQNGTFLGGPIVAGVKSTGLVTVANVIGNNFTSSGGALTVGTGNAVQATNGGNVTIDVGTGAVTLGKGSQLSGVAGVGIEAGSVANDGKITSGQYLSIDNSASLVPSDLTLTGSGTYATTTALSLSATGNIGLDGLFTGAFATAGGATVLVVAGGNISSTKTGTINTSNIAGAGGAISLIAGANYVFDVKSPTTVTVSQTANPGGGSATGGTINMPNISLAANSTSGANGGNITLGAYGSGSGTPDGTGLITVSNISTTTSGLGQAGYVLIGAGGTTAGPTAASITTGNIAGGGQTPPGIIFGPGVYIGTASPVASVGGVVFLSGVQTSGQFAAGTFQTGGVTTGNITSTSTGLTTGLGNIVGVRAGGNISANDVTGQFVVLQATQGSNGGVQVHNINAPGFVTLTGDGTGTISQTAGGLITTPTLTATVDALGTAGAGTGDITVNTTNGASPINLSIASQGNVTDTNLGSVNLVSLNGAGATKTYSVTTSSNAKVQDAFISIQVPIAAGTINLSTSSQNGFNGSITQSIGGTSLTADAINLSAKGTPGFQDITLNTAAATSGTDVAMTANTTGSVFINNIGGVSFGDSKVGGGFTLFNTADGAGNSSITVSAGKTVSAGGQLEFVTDQTGSTAPSVTVGAGSTLSAANMILETTNVTNNGSISSKGFLAVDNSTGGQGLTFGGTGGTWSAGTVLVAAATNDVDLAGLFNANQTVNLKGANFAAIAGGDIVASGAETAIVTGGGQINMFAGANYNTGTLQVTPGAGGDVTFNGGLDSSNKSGSGGLVQVVAYGNGATGTVNIGGDIKTGGSGSNSNGDVLVLAGSNASIKSITLANVDTSGASSKLPTGDITIATAAPNTNPISFTLSGTTTPAGVGATALGEVSTGNLTSGTGNVLVIGTEGITTGSVTATKGSITETSTALNGFITATGDMKAGTFVNLQATNDIQTTNVTASTGAVTENSAAGSITNGDVFAGTNVGLSAAVDITTAKVTAGTGINETAGNDLTATGDMLTTNGNVKLTATGSISTAAVTASNGTVNFDPTSITATGIITGTTVDLVASTFISTVGIVSTVGATTVNAGTTFTDTGAISSATKADLTAGTDMSLGSASTSNGDLTATATAGSLSASGALSSKNGLTSLTAGTFISTNGITATGVGSSITAKAGSSITDTGSINAGTTVNLDAGTFISTVGVAAGTGLTETAKTSITDTTALSTTTGNLSLTAGTSISAKDITATAGSVTATTAGGTFITATGAINAGTTVSLTAETDISTTSVTAGTGVTETANTGSITATGTISTTTSGAVVLNAVTGITTTDVTANGVGGSVQETTTGKGSSIKGNVITGNTFVTLTADQDITTDAVTATTLAVTETATNGLLTANGDITAGTSVSLTAGSDISVVGVTASNGFLSATSNKGSITATGNMSSNGGDTTFLADTFISTLDVTATGTGIEHITETATNGSITGGKLTADKSIALTAGTDVTTSDLTSNLRRVDVTAGTGGKTGSITAGAVSANFAIGLSALDNITTDSQTTQTFSISNTATNGFIQANGALSSNGSVTLSAGTDISTVGVTAKNGSVSETATKGSITDTTSIAANTTVNLTAGTFISTGDVSGNTSVTETAKNGDINSSGVITTPVLVLSATTGIGSLGSPLQTKGVGGTIDLTAASTSGAVAIDNNGAVVLLNANGTDANSTFQLITTPDSTNGNGSISIGNGVTGATVSGGTLIISSSEDSSIVGATGGISEGKASTTPTLTGTTIVLTDHDVTGLANGNGDITVGMTNGGALINLVANTDGDVNLNAYGSSVNLNGASSGFFFNLTTNSDSTNINGAIALNAGIKAFATQLTSSEFTGGTGGISGPGVIDAGFVTLADHDSNGAPFNTNGTGNISANTTNSAGGSVILQANTTGNVTIVDTSKSLVMNSSTGKDITLTANAVDTFKLPSTIAATGNLTINTDSLTVQNGDTFKGLNVFINGVTPDNNKVNMVVTNDGTIQATGQNLTIASAAGQNLVVGSSLPLGGTLSATDSGAGDGHISVVASNDVGNNIFPTLEFTGSQTFAFTGGTKTGVVDLTSKGAATSGIIIDAPATLTFNMNGSAINLNTCTVVLNGTLDINPIGFGVPVNTLTLNCPLAASTIARSDGAPLNLNGLNLTFNGLDLNILSAGDIEDTKIGTDTINLSSATKGGSVNIIAGFKFAPGTLPGGQTEISNKLYTLTSQNPLGGSILLGNVNINTSGGTDGGNVFVVANAGSIVLGKVTTTGSTGNGGSVTMYGDGIVANNINTSGGLASGNVDLQSVTTVGLPAANIYVGGGKVFGGSFVLGTPGGEINLTSVTSPGANVSIITGGMGVGTSGVIASGTINAGNLLIVSGIDGSTGIKTTATTLTASSLGDIDITDSSAVTLVDNGTFKNTSALGAYTLTTTGAASDITVTDAVSATTNMTLKAGGALAINNTVDGITVDLSSGGNTTINDAVTATLSGTVTSSGAVTVTGAGSFTAGTSLDVVATNNVTVDGFVTANTDLNVTSSKGDITGGGTYTSTVGNIILAADGNIWQDSSTALNISTANINAAATKGSVNLLNDQTTNIVFVGANSNSAGGTYTLTTSTGDINLNDDVSGGTGVSLVSPGALTGAGTVTATTGDILLQAVTAVNLTGSVAAFTGNVGISGNSVLTFDVLGTKSVTEISTTTIDSTGVITGANLTFNAGTGIASLGTPLQTAGVNGTTNLTATTKTGDVAINNNGAVVLIGTNSAKAGTFQLSTTPDGTTGDGSISIGDATNGATVSAVTINLTSSEDSTIFGSKGGIHEGAASVTPTLSSGNINLTDLDETLAPGTGDIVVGLRNPGGAPINLTANTAGNVDLHTFGSTVNIAGTSTGDTFSIVTASSAGVTKNGNIVLNNDIIANNIILTSSEYTGGTGGVSGAGVLHADSVTIVDTNSAGVPGNTTGKGVINVNTDNALGSTTFSAQSAAAITVTDNSLTSLILGNINGTTVTVNGNTAVDTVGGGANVLVKASTALNINTDNLSVQLGDTLQGPALNITGITPGLANTMTVTNDGTIQATGKTLNIASAAGENLVISSTVNGPGTLEAANGGTINVVATNDVGIFPQLSFTGSQNFAFIGGAIKGTVNLTSTGGANSGINILNNSALTFNMANSTINFNTCDVILNGTLNINPGGKFINNTLVINCPLAVGTIARSDGAALDISGFGLVYNGKDLDILSAGDIISSAPATIDLSSGTDGGNLNMIAGFKFTPGTPGGLPTQGNTLYTLNNPNTGTGSINLGNVNINTSGTNNGGNVFAVTNGGSITLGNVDTSGTITGGNVTLMGNGITTGTINTAAGLSGDVKLTSAATVTPNNVVYVGGGTIIGSFTAGTAGGNIATSTITATGANVSMTTGGTGSITNAGGIDTGSLLLVSGTGGSTGISTSAANLTANSTGAVAITDTNATGVTLVANGKIHNSATDNFSLTTTSGDITVTDTLDGGTTAGKGVTLDSAGAINGSGVVSVNNATGNLFLTAVDDIGASGAGNALNVNAANLNAQSTSGSVYISDAQAVTTVINGANSNSAFGSYNLTTTKGNITVTDGITGGSDVSLNSAGDINGTGTVTATTGTAFLTAAGNIWGSSTPTAFKVDAAQLSANAGTGAVNITDAQAVDLVVNGTTHNAAGTTFTLATTAGDITVDDTVTGGKGVTFTPAGSIIVNQNVTATTGAVTLTTNSLTTAAKTTIQGDSIAIKSAGGDLFVENAGTILANADGNIQIDSAIDKNVTIGNSANVTPGVFQVSGVGRIIVNANASGVASTNSIIFDGNLNLNTDKTGETDLNANTGTNQQVIVDGGKANPNILVAGNNNVFVNSNFLTKLNGGDITGNKLFFNSATGAGTISDTSNNFTLTNLTYNGKSLTILGTGAITLGSGLTIDLSSSSGNGGDLSIIAGYSFVPNVSTPTGPIVPSSTPYTLGAESGNGGSVTFAAGSTINTSSTSNNGGNVLIVAAGTTAGTGGTISIGGNINASGAVNGGNVNMIAQGISVNGINTTGGTGTSGNVSLQSAAPVQVGTVISTNGVLSGGFKAQVGTFAGNITTGASAINAGKGTVTMTTGAGSSITTGTGTITGSTVSLTSASGGAVTANGLISAVGGTVNLISDTGNVSTGAGGITVGTGTINMTTSTNTITTGTGNLSAIGGTVNLTNSLAGNITTGTGGITVGDATHNGTINLATDSGVINASVGTLSAGLVTGSGTINETTTTGNIISGNAVAANANLTTTSGQISTSGATVISTGKLSLDVGSGNAGTSAAFLNANATSINTKGTGSAFINDGLATIVNLDTNSVATLNVNAPNAVTVNVDAVKNTSHSLTITSNGAVNFGGASTFGLTVDGSGNGGILAITAKSIASTNVTGITFDNSGTLGDGGSVAINITGGGTTTLGTGALNNIAIKATGGSNGGAKGGSASLTTAGTLAINTDANGDLVSSTLNVGPTGGTNGAGGSIALKATSFTYSASATKSLNLTANGDGTGQGGSVSVTQTGAGAATIGTAAGQFHLTATSPAGDGGSVAFSTAGTLTVANGAGLTVAPVTAGNGGIIALTAASYTMPGSGPFSLNADGKGANGLGGFISVTQTGNATATIGTATGQFQFSAAGGNNSSKSFNNGNGSGVSFASGGALIVNPAGINVAATVSNSDGENITLQSKSTTVFNIGQNTTANKNGVKGVLSVAGNGTGIAGSETFINLGGGVTNSVALTSNFSNLTMIAGGAGAVNVAKAITTTSKNGTVTLSAGTGTGAISGTGVVTAPNVVLSTNAGKIGTLNLVTTDITANSTGGDVSLVDKNAAGTTVVIENSSAGIGKTFTLTDSLGNIATKGNIVAGSIVLKASATTAGNGNVNIGAASTLNAQGTALPFVSNGVITITAGGATGAGGNITAAPGSELSAAKTITLTAAKGDIQVGNIGNVVGTTLTTVNLTALNNITQTAGTNIKASLAVTEKATGAAGNIAVNGNITVTASTAATSVALSSSGSGGVSVAAGTTITGNKAVTITATKGGIASNGSINAGTSIAINASSTTAGNVTVNNLKTTNGPISVLASGLNLTVQPGAKILANSTGATKATITINDKNAGASTINIGASANIITNGPSGSNVTIANNTTTATNSTLPSVVGTTFNPSGSPSTVFFFGATPANVKFNSSLAAPIQVNSINNGKVIFNTGTKGGTINIAGGTVGSPTIITGDPPASAAAPSAQAVAQAKAELMNVLAVPSIQTTTPSTTQVNATSGINLSDSGATFSSGLANTGAIAAMNAASMNLGAAGITGGLIGALQSSVVDASTTAPTARTLYGQATEYGVPSETMYIGKGTNELGEVEAAVLGVSDIGIAGPKTIEMGAWTGPDTKVAVLRKGNVVVAPDHDTTIETAFGKVTVAARAVALIMALPTGTAVFNLDDTHKDSVVVTIGKTRMPLAPGRHTMITSHLVSGFEMVNPAEGLAHRNVTSHKLDGDLQAFHSEFLMAHAIGKIKQLKLLVNSNAPEAKRVSSHLLKTAAIVSQLGGANAAQYQLYQHPRMTASADLK